MSNDNHTTTSFTTGFSFFPWGNSLNINITKQLLENNQTSLIYSFIKELKISALSNKKTLLNKKGIEQSEELLINETSCKQIIFQLEGEISNQENEESDSLNFNYLIGTKYLSVTANKNIEHQVLAEASQNLPDFLKLDDLNTTNISLTKLSYGISIYSHNALTRLFSTAPIESTQITCTIGDSIKISITSSGQDKNFNQLKRIEEIIGIENYLKINLGLELFNLCQN